MIRRTSDVEQRLQALSPKLLQQKLDNKTYQIFLFQFLIPKLLERSSNDKVDFTQ